MRKEEDVIMKGARRRLHKKLLAAIVVVLSIVLFLLYFTYSPFRSFVDTKILRKEITESQANSINLPSVSTNDVFSVGSKTYILQNGNLKVYNQMPKEEKSLSLTVGEPIFDNADDYMVIADKNSTNVYLIKDGEILWDKKTDMPIIHVSVNKNGKVVLVTKHSIYKALVTVVGVKGKDEVRTYISEGYVIDADISKDDKFLAIGVVDYSKTTANSHVKVVNLDQKKDSKEGEDNKQITEYTRPSLLIDLSVKDTGELVVRYAKEIVRYSLKAKSEEVIYTAKDETEYIDVSNRTVNAIIEKESQNVFQTKYIIKIINNYGKQIFASSFEDSSVRSFKAHGDYIAINRGKEIIVLTNNGFTKKRYVSKTEAIDYIINERQLIVIFKDKIDIIPM